MSLTRRAVLAIYGLAAVCIFTWVPWRGEKLLRINPVVASNVGLGYAPLWAPPKLTQDIYVDVGVNHDMVLLEFAALTGLVLVVWVIIPAQSQAGVRQ